MAEGEGRKGQRAALHFLRPVLIYISFGAGNEGGAAEVESAQSARRGLHVIVAARHLAQKAQVRAVECAFDAEARHLVFLLLTDERGQRAGRFDKNLARLGVHGGGKEAREDGEEKECCVFHDIYI